jgi:hypothetical protein
MQNWHLLYNTATGASVSIGTVIADPLPADITALPLTDEQGEGLQNGSLKWDEATRTLVPTPPPAVTAEEWTERFFSSAQIIALQRFEFALQQAGKSLGPNMTALKSWLETMLLESANPAPRTFSEPPCSYSVAAMEAVSSLNPES